MEQKEPKITLRGQKKKGRTLLAILLAALVLVGGVCAFFAIYLGQNSAPPQVELPTPTPTPTPTPDGEEEPDDAPVIASPARKEGVYSILVVGLDYPQNSRNTDVLMLCSFDTVSGAVNIMQIPRDIYVTDPLATRGTKINNIFNLACFDYQNKTPADEFSKDAMYHYGMSYLKSKITALFSVPIDFHVSFNTVMYRSLLEVVCPITVTVPFDMDYDDSSQNLHIHLKAGTQQLNAEQAEGFSRFRQNNAGQSLLEGDFTRVDLQKQVLAAIADKVLTSISLPQAQAFVGQIINNVETNMTLDNCIWFFERALSLYASGTMTLDSIRMYDLPCYIPSIATIQNKLGIFAAYGFMEKHLGYTVEILNRAFRLTEAEITADMLGYDDPEGWPITSCDHSDTEGKSLQELLDNPIDLQLYG